MHVKSNETQKYNFRERNLAHLPETGFLSFIVSFGLTPLRLAGTVITATVEDVGAGAQSGTAPASVFGPVVPFVASIGSLCCIRESGGGVVATFSCALVVFSFSGGIEPSSSEVALFASLRVGPLIFCTAWKPMFTLIVFFSFDFPV